MTIQNGNTPRAMERNSNIRAEIEKAIMQMNNLQDDLIEKYLFNDDDIERGKREMWELRRRFTMITSGLRRLKDEFIPVPHVPPYLRPEANTTPAAHIGPIYNLSRFPEDKEPLRK